MAEISRRRPLKKVVYPYLFILPFLLITFVFFVLPAIYTIAMSFTDMKESLKLHFIGAGNFIKILGDVNLPGIVANTFIFAGFSLVSSLVLALAIAISTQYYLKGKTAGTFYRVLWLIPNVMPSVVYVAFWKWFFDPTWDGFLNKVAESMQAAKPIAWFNNFSMEIVVLATVISSVSGSVILLSAAINSIPEDLFKAAQVDGASEKSIIRKIILPALKWPLMYVTISNSIGFIASYFFIMLLTLGGPLKKTTTLSLYAYQQAFNMRHYGYGAAISLIVVFFALILTILLIRLFDFDSMIKPSRIEE